MAKIMQTAQFIVEHGIDLIAIQEANQLQNYARPVLRSPHYAGSTSLPIGADNYAAILAHACAHLGENYYFYWAEAHEGFGLYDEGVGILQRVDKKDADKKTTGKQAESEERKPEVILLGDYPYEDIRRRVALAIPMAWPGKNQNGKGWAVTAHFSWWEKEKEHLFAAEWEKIEEFAHKHVEEGILVLGDFNNPAHKSEEGYDLVRSQGWQDLRDLANTVTGENTIPGNIAGWEKTKEPARIDYIFTNKPLTVQSHHIVLDGEHSPLVSDHYGVMVEIEG